MWSHLQPIWQALSVKIFSFRSLSVLWQHLRPLQYFFPGVLYIYIYEWVKLSNKNRQDPHQPSIAYLLNGSVTSLERNYDIFDSFLIYSIVTKWRVCSRLVWQGLRSFPIAGGPTFKKLSVVKSQFTKQRVKLVMIMPLLENSSHPAFVLPSYPLPRMP